MFALQTPITCFHVVSINVQVHVPSISNNFYSRHLNSRFTCQKYQPIKFAIIYTFHFSLFLSISQKHLAVLLASRRTVATTQTAFLLGDVSCEVLHRQCLLSPVDRSPFGRQRVRWQRVLANNRILILSYNGMSQWRSDKRASYIVASNSSAIRM